MVEIKLIGGDCKTVMASMKEASVGSVICDPPYGISFMGKDFDKLGEGGSQQLWHREWLDEAYRVLQHGGAIKAFGGTRTYHRMAAAMQQAGFTDIRLEAWNYGSGFPKSLNIGKALDKEAGSERTQVIGQGSAGAAFHYGNPGEGGFGQIAHLEGGVPSSSWDIKAPVTEDAQKWNGWGTALKPGWEPIVVGRKP